MGLKCLIESHRHPIMLWKGKTQQVSEGKWQIILQLTEMGPVYMKFSSL